MRLSAQERTAIQAAVASADPQAKIYLFGSRVDDKLRGGDIDLLVLSERLTLGDKLDILSRMKDELGEQKIDLLVRSARQASEDPFVSAILKAAIPL